MKCFFKAEMWIQQPFKEDMCLSWVVKMHYSLKYLESGSCWVCVWGGGGCFMQKSTWRTCFLMIQKAFQCSSFTSEHKLLMYYPYLPERCPNNCSTVRKVLLLLLLCLTVKDVSVAESLAVLCQCLIMINLLFLSDVIYDSEAAADTNLFSPWHFHTNCLFFFLSRHAWWALLGCGEQLGQWASTAPPVSYFSQTATHQKKTKK